MKSNSPSPQWSPDDIAVMRPREALTISQWAEKYLPLPPESEMKGTWIPSVTPFWADLMDTWCMDPRISSISICAAAQIGKTLFAFSTLGYYAHQQPVPALVVLADEDTSKSMSIRRWARMWEDSSDLSRMIDRGRWTQTERGYLDGNVTVFGWASSVARLASFSYGICYADEIDKPGYSAATREASALSLIQERMSTYHGAKFIKTSTPTDEFGNITGELEQADAVFDWHVPCPFCGQFQPLRWSREYCFGFQDAKYRGEDGEHHPVGEVQWEGGSDANHEQIAAARYVCGSCGERWTTQQKNEAVQAGKWLPRAELNGFEHNVAFHVNRLYSLFAGGRIEAITGDWVNIHRIDNREQRNAKLQGFVNSTLAEPWVNKIVASSLSDIYKATVDLDPHIVPAEAVALTCFVDVQKYGRWFAVRAWAKDFTSWLIHYGNLPTWEDVEELLFSREYQIQDSDRIMKIWRAGVDTGGGDQETGVSMTEETYTWLRNNATGRGCRVWACKGSSTRLAGKVHLGSPLTKTPAGRPIPGGLQIVMLDTEKLKDAFHYRLQLAQEGGNQGAYLHREIEKTYVRQITAEEKRLDRRGRTEWIKIRRDNHLLDCFDSETELLTTTGWMPVSSVDAHDLCATVNLDTNEIEYQKPFRLISRHHKGEMLKISGRRIDVLVTPNHRMVVYQKRGTRVNGKSKAIFDSNPSVKLAHELSIWDRIKIATQWRGEAIEVIEIPACEGKRKYHPIFVDALDFASFLGWFVSEGHCGEYGHEYRVVISQSKEPNKDDIARLLNGLPWKWSLIGDRQFVINSKQLFTYLKSTGIGEKQPFRCVPSVIKMAKPGVIRAFLDAAIVGDGWVQRGFRTYATTSRVLADDIQEMFLKIGKSSNIKMVQPPSCRIRGGLSPTRPQYHVTECSTLAASLRDGKNNPIFSMVPFNGPVHCVSVPNGTLVCRRNGKAFIAGNCECGNLALADPEWPGGGVNTLTSQQRGSEDGKTRPQAAQPAISIPKPNLGGRTINPSYRRNYGLRR